MDKEFDKYFKKIEGFEYDEFHYLTLIQDNSENLNNLFHKKNTISDDEINAIIEYLYEFFTLYLFNFEGNEREEVHKILFRILPGQYHEKVVIENFLMKYDNYEQGFSRSTQNQFLTDEENKKNKSEINSLFADKKKQKEKQELNIENNKVDRDNSDLDDQTIIILSFKGEGKDRKVAGGIILEYYAARDNGKPFNNGVQISEYESVSNCILTYIFIDELERNKKSGKSKGLGTALIKKVLPICINNDIYSCKRNENHEYVFDDNNAKIKNKPQYVFFEVDNPIYIYDKNSEEYNKNEKVDEPDKYLKQSKKENLCIKRLNFFKEKANARWLDISYVQPELSDEQAPVYNLFFMILWEVSKGLNNTFVIDKNRILDFLINFYNNLRKEKIKKNRGEQIKFDDFLLKKSTNSTKEIANIINKDVDLARTWLAIEIADAIDDFENEGNIQKVSELKLLQKNIENQFDFIADEIVKCNSDQSKIRQTISFLNDYFVGKLKKIEDLNEHEKDLKIKIDLLKKEEQFDSLTSIKDKLIKILNNGNSHFDNQEFYLKEVPKFAVPNLLFDKASVTFHIALNPNITTTNVIVNKKGELVQITNNELNTRFKPKEIPFDLLLLSKEYKKGDNTHDLLSFEEIICPIFGSYQNDLLAYNYYDKKAPIKSKSIGTFEVDVTFPYKIEFLSEGRKESLFIDNSKPDNISNDKIKNPVLYAIPIDDDEKKYYSYKKRIKCFLNLMFFKPDEIEELYEKYKKISKKRKLKKNADKKIKRDYEFHYAKNIVWELVFTNDTEDENNAKIILTEYEIIQLSKFFSGKQEKSNINLEINYVESNNSKKIEEVDLYKNIVEILKKNAKNQNSIYGIHAGTIQIDTFNAKICSFKEERENSTTSKYQYYSYNPLFSTESEEDEVDNLKFKEGYINHDIRIKTLLEEYLKDNVDNIDLFEQIYYKQKSKNEQISNLEVYRNVRDFQFDDAFTGFEDRYNENAFLKYFFDTLCGIALGIFDFQRMGYEEVTDTIAPLYESATDNAMIIMKRGSLFSLCHKNSVYESSLNTIGISPYLIIPNSVLVYNRLQGDSNKEMIDNYFKLSKDETSNQEYLKIRKEAKKNFDINNNDLYQLLLHLRKRTEIYLNKIQIPNVFNYTTEQEIFSVGMKDRGVDENISQIKEIKKELDESIKDLLDIRQTIFSLLITIFLGIISFVGFWDPIVTHLDFEGKSFYIANTFLEGQYTFNIGAVIFTFLFGIFIIYFGTRLRNILPRYVTVDSRKLIIILLFVIILFGIICFSIF